MSKNQNYFNMKIHELQKIAKENELSNYSNIKKNDLIIKLLETDAGQEGLAFVTGCLEVVDDGYGFLRFAENS